MKTLSMSWIVLILAGIGLAHVFPVGVTAILGALLLWSLRGPAASIQAMTLATLLSYLNPTIGVLPPEAGVLTRLILLVAALRVLPTIRAHSLPLLWPVWLFAVVAGILSTVSSSAVAISVMKVLTFAVAATTVLTAYDSLSPTQIANLQRWFATVGTVFLVASLATLVSPHVAFYTNGTGFQGLLNNAQALAVLLAPFAAWQMTGVLFSSGYLRWITVAALSLIYVGLFLSESRTGMLASLIGTSAAGVTWLFSGKRVALLAGRGRVAALGAVAILALSGLIVSGHFQTTIVKFAFKRAEAREVSGAFLESRGGGVVTQWAHFTEQPWLGHGFGVYAEGPPSGAVIEVMGIPISAPIEKGFVFTAVLEESGLLGGLCFFTMLFILGRAAWRNGDVRWIALFVACIGVNIGECILLSPGGIGLLDWLLIGLAISSARAAVTPVPYRFLSPVEVQFPNLLRS